jgi:DNA polymerase III epsilon subunit-like protein
MRGLSIAERAAEVEGLSSEQPWYYLHTTSPTRCIALVIRTACDGMGGPMGAITPMARRFHHISDSDVASAPTVAELAEEIRAFLERAVFVAHNAPIDLGVRRETFDVVG